MTGSHGELSEQTSLTYGPEALENLYTRLDKLGEGTFGTVYKAQDLRSHGYVALKRIPFSAEDDEGLDVFLIRHQ